MPFNMNIDTDNAAFHGEDEEPRSWGVYLDDIIVAGPFEDQEAADHARQTAINSGDESAEELEVRQDDGEFAGDPYGPDPSETCRAEVARILRKVADRVESGHDTRSWRTILDANGNSCGQWRLALEPTPG